MEFTTSTTSTGSATGSAISGEMNIQPETVSALFQLCVAKEEVTMGCLNQTLN